MAAPMAGMGLAPGGRMRQEIYEDPYSIRDWDIRKLVGKVVCEVRRLERIWICPVVDFRMTISKRHDS